MLPLPGGVVGNALIEMLTVIWQVVCIKNVAARDEVPSYLWSDRFKAGHACFQRKRGNACPQSACTFRQCPATISMSSASWLCYNSLTQKRILVNIRCIQETYRPVKCSKSVTFRKHVI